MDGTVPYRKSFTVKKTNIRWPERLKAKLKYHLSFRKNPKNI